MVHHLTQETKGRDTPAIYSGYKAHDNPRNHTTYFSLNKCNHQSQKFQNFWVHLKYSLLRLHCDSRRLLPEKKRCQHCQKVQAVFVAFRNPISFYCSLVWLRPHPLSTTYGKSQLQIEHDSALSWSRVTLLEFAVNMIGDLRYLWFFIVMPTCTLTI